MGKAPSKLATELQKVRQSALKVDQILRDLPEEADRRLLTEALTERLENGHYAVSAEKVGEALTKAGISCSGDAVVKWRKRHQGDV